MTVARSAKYYQERKGRIATDRGPVPRLAPGLNRALDVPVSPPHPDPIYLRYTQGQPEPDRGLTDIWPHGTDGESPQ